MNTAVVIVVAMIVLASLAFLVFGLFRSQGGPKVTDGHRWTAQATLAEMRKEGGGLPTEVGAEANRSQSSPGSEPPGTPIQGSPPPSGVD